MTRESQQRWQPISRLPLIASMIDGMLEDSQEQYQTFSEIRKKPHVLDDATVSRGIRVYIAAFRFFRDRQRYGNPSQSSKDIMRKKRELA